MRFKRAKTTSDTATCAEVMKHLQSYIDGEMRDDVTARRVAAHLEMCRRCGLEFETYKRLKNSLQQLGPLDQQAISRLSQFAQSLGEREDGDEIELG
ncbi:MAG: zf-HC2 domain-containing protein [Actinobacteria bacterium]|nr:zf-HC2 domain-containing protein [Actinomycetota bacterium]